jgi:hypothetical protein
MPIYDIYSKRKRRSAQTASDVYQYETIPPQLRRQIQHIWTDAFGPYREQNLYSRTPNNNSGWRLVREALCREKGLARLANGDDPHDDCISYLHTASEINDLLDLIELTFLVIWNLRNTGEVRLREKYGIRQAPDDAIRELNFRLREAGVGYQFESGEIVRVDSQLVHSEVVKPALQLLADPRFKGAQEEFFAAHAHYRAGEHKDAVADALNAFESTLKVICGEKKWPYQKGARATDLLKVVRSNGLLPDYLDTSFDQLAGTLASGLPKVRNEAGGHGQGA